MTAAPFFRHLNGAVHAKERIFMAKPPRFFRRGAHDARRHLLLGEHEPPFRASDKPNQPAPREFSGVALVQSFTALIPIDAVVQDRAARVTYDPSQNARLVCCNARLQSHTPGPRGAIEPAKLPAAGGFL